MRTTGNSSACCKLHQFLLAALCRVIERARAMICAAAAATALIFRESSKGFPAGFHDMAQ